MNQERSKLIVKDIKSLTFK